MREVDHDCCRACRTVGYSWVIRLYLRSVVRRSMVSCLYDSGVGERVESDLFFACSPTPIDGYTVLWVEHYPRGIETIAATIVSCMGNLDAGKALNLWFVFSSIVYILFILMLLFADDE